MSDIAKKWYVLRAVSGKENKVKEYLDAAKAAERKKFEEKRDSILISLGLVDPDKTKREYSDLDYYTYAYPEWDPEKRKHYRIVHEPVEVTDEEFEEIMKYAPKVSKKEVSNDIKYTPQCVEVENGAEKFLAVVNNIALAIGIIAAVFLLFIALNSNKIAGYFVLSALGVLLVSFVSWAVVKVVLNVSNNLHEINAKM